MSSAICHSVTSTLTLVWPSSVSRAADGNSTSLYLFTGKDWVGRYEDDVCVIIRQITGNIP